MNRTCLTRRRLLFVSGISLAVTPIVAACAQGPSSPPSTQPSGTAPKSSTAAAAPAASAAGAAQLSVTVRAEKGGAGDWQRDAYQQYAKIHPNVKISEIAVPYNDMAKKQLTFLATGTMPDVVYSGIKWFDYSAFKGAFLTLNDYTRASDPGMDDFFKSAVQGCNLEGKLYGLPIELNTGNQNIILVNTTYFDSKGIKPPTDDWSLDDFSKMASKLTDPVKKVFGTDFLTQTYYDFAALARSYGTDLLSSDGKKISLSTDPKSTEAAKWQTELRTTYKGAPTRTAAQGINFASGQVALNANGIYGVVPAKAEVADKFKWDVVLWPKGPGGLRGYEAFVGMYSLSSKTKAPDNAYDLLKFFVSKEMAQLSYVKYGYSSARVSVWRSPELQKISSIFGRAADWMADGKNQGPFPMPYNLRFSELQDKWANLSLAVFYGETDFEKGLQNLQAELDKIIALPRG